MTAPRAVMQIQPQEFHRQRKTPASGVMLLNDGMMLL